MGFMVVLMVLWLLFGDGVAKEKLSSLRGRK
jgi:hypothetical protein